MSDQPTINLTTINLTIDGKAISVPKGTTVYTAAQKLGIDIPIFCYQDRMPPFGACRMCLVEVEKMNKLQASCTLEAFEGMIVKTQSETAVKGREGILELLLINHPLDCPICDRGGECPLQDQTLKHGPGASRFFEEKRHYTKRKPLGPVLMLDRERCIQCARCTRFGEIVAGDHALEFIDRGYRLEVGTPNGGPAESKFIGNTIMICPVGALTSDVYRFKARPWDNQPTSSSCTLCPVGCSLILDERDGEIVRTRSEENKKVNDIWLCDKGWFGYEFNSNPNRLKTPLIRREGQLVPASWEEALSLIVSKIKISTTFAAFGGNPLTVEENYLFQKLMREGCGTDNLDHRIGMPIFTREKEGLPAGMETEIADCENLDYVIFLGLDLTEEFPVIWLRLKQALNKGAKSYFFGHYAPEIASNLTEVTLHAPGEEIETISQIKQRSGKGAIFIGRQYLHSPQRLAILSQALTLNLPLNLMEGRGNSRGAFFAGMRPDFGPSEKPIEKPGLNAQEVLQTAAKAGWDFLYVAGANPVKKFPSKLWSEARSQLKFLIVQDLFLSETAIQADVVLPTLSYVEKKGSFINIEGRIQQLLPGKPIPEGLYSDGEIFKRLAEKLKVPLAIDAEFINLLKQERLPLKRGSLVKEPINSRGNGLFATLAPALFDQGVRMRHNPHVIQLAKEPSVRVHPAEGEKRNLRDDQRITLSANGNAIQVKIKFDPKVAQGTIVLPLGFDHLPVHELGLNFMNGHPIEVQHAN